MLSAEVIDDDGVLVLASAARLKARFATRSFDYTFPNELVGAAAQEELCAWLTHEEGEVTIHVFHTEPPPADASFVGLLRLEPADELLVLAYSQYTMACSHHRGSLDNSQNLCGRLAVEPGRYACWVRPTPQELPPETDDEWSLAFDVYLTAAQPSDKPLPDIPIVQQN